MAVMTDPAASVNAASQRFETSVDGHTAFLDFRRHDDRIVLVHTEVPDEIGGRGVAGALARFALAYARDNNLTVVPQCPYVRSYLEKHPDEAAQTKVEG